MRVAKSNNTQHQHAHNNNKAPTAGHHPPVRSNAIAKKQPVPQFNPKNSPVNNLKSHAARAMISSSPSPQPKSEQSKPTSSTSMSFPRGNNGKFLPRNNNNNNNSGSSGCGDFNNNASNNNNCGNNNNNGQQQPDANVNRSTVLPPPPSFGATFYPSACPGARMF